MSDGNFLELPACPYSLLHQLQTVCAYMYMYQILKTTSWFEKEFFLLVTVFVMFI